MSGPATVGWCPGALRPMESGDGFILRVKPRGSRLTLDQAEAVARLSECFGNGHLDLTGRANLQIRGARPETLGALTAGLREAGLLDADMAVEALRNIVASPLVGFDPDCFDTRPFLAQLERCLGAGAPDPARSAPTRQPGTGNLHGSAPLVALPAKWSFVVDGGGRLPLAGTPADMRFRFERSGTLRIGLDTAWSEPMSGAVDLDRLLGAAAALVAAQPRPMRMKSLLARLGRDTVFARLGLRLARASTVPSVPARSDLFAVDDALVAFAPPFGSLSAKLFELIIEACRATGGAELRLTPWRMLLAPGIADRATLQARLAGLGLILDAADPRLQVSACVGAPACHRATTSTRTDAALLAERLGRDLDGTVHIAGCTKGCARPQDAAWTLVAHEGRYDVLQADDPVPHVEGLSFTDAANWLSRANRARIS